jgi:hypothetical protein
VPELPACRPSGAQAAAFDRGDAGAAAALAAGALAYFASFAPWNRPVLLDAATWDWMATEVARGMIPYRDVFLHKTPGSALVGSVGVTAGNALGFEPVLAAHALYLLLGTAGAVLLFLLCRTRLPLGPSLAAGVALLAFDEWTIAALEGCRPKVPTTVFGLAALLAAERRAVFSSSILGGMSVLCWQPGVAFLFGAWAAVWRRGERRPARLAAIAAASLLPAVLLLGWLAANGALRDFWEQAVLFNLHYIDEKARPPLGTLRAFARTIGAWNDVETLLAPAAVAGLLLRRGTLRLPVSLAVFGAAYLAMTFVSYQSWPDAILLGPIVSALLATGLWSLLASKLDARAATAGALLVLALAAIPDGKAKFDPPIAFDEQRRRFRALEAGLDADDRVVGVSVPEFFLHTGRPNGWKWPYFWFGVDEFAAAHDAGGFDGILAELDGDPPELILVARLWAGPQRQRFEVWAESRYERTTEKLFPHLRRPLVVYRRLRR